MRHLASRFSSFMSFFNCKQTDSYFTFIHVIEWYLICMLNTFDDTLSSRGTSCEFLLKFTFHIQMQRSDSPKLALTNCSHCFWNKNTYREPGLNCWMCVLISTVSWQTIKRGHLAKWSAPHTFTSSRDTHNRRGKKKIDLNIHCWLNIYSQICVGSKCDDYISIFFSFFFKIEHLS